jgi:glycosyltransferase involved in cell wall biosynthesis
VTVKLVAFESGSLAQDDVRRLADEFRKAGIQWVSVRRSAGLNPVAVVQNIARGVTAASRLLGGSGRPIVHCRSYVPGIIGVLLKARFKVPFVFDMRGFWIDERVMRGSLRQDSPGYRFGKRLETVLYRKSDAIVSLTEAGVSEILRLDPWRGGPRPPITMIPTCVDLNRFPPPTRRSHRNPVVVSVGSLGKGYLAEEIFVVFSEIRKRHRDARLKIVSRSDSSGLAMMAEAAGVPPSAWSIQSAEPDEVPAILSECDIGLSFIEPHYSKKASCATKNAEYLAAGIPIVANSGIGDVDTVLPQHGVGVVLPDFESPSVERGVDALERLLADPETPDRCVLLARREYATGVGVDRYMGIYQRLWNPSAAGAAAAGAEAL